jgi:hypothetical protein
LEALVRVGESAHAVELLHGSRLIKRPRFGIAASASRPAYKYPCQLEIVDEVPKTVR